MHRLVDCSKFEAEVAPSRQPIFESGESAGAVPILAAVAAVVEAQDVACAGGGRPESSRAVCDRLHPGDQPLGCGRVPVARYQRPHDDAQIEARAQRPPSHGLRKPKGGRNHFGGATLAHSQSRPGNAAIRPGFAMGQARKDSDASRCDCRSRDPWRQFLAPAPGIRARNVRSRKKVARAS